MADYFIDGKMDIKTVLSEKISLSGELSFEDSLEIHGEFSGIIRSKGLLVIGPSAVIHGDIYSRDLIVEGKIFGNILVYNRLSVESQAEITGDITTHKIKVMNNAVLDGNCFTLDTPELLKKFDVVAPDGYFRENYSPPPKPSSKIGKPSAPAEETKEKDLLETAKTSQVPNKSKRNRKK